MSSSLRCIYYKFRRIQTPPLKRPRESPYIIGPYLKPDYLANGQFITDSIKARHDDHLNYFIYEKQPVFMDTERQIKLLLIEDVEGLGVAGQVVDTNYRQGSSRLIAMRKAVYATDFNLSWYKFGPKTFKSASSALSQRTARNLSTTIFDLPVSQKTIEPWHLSLSLRLAGCNCPVETISNLERIDDSRVNCQVKINNHESVTVQFKIKPKE